MIPTATFWRGSGRQLEIVFGNASLWPGVGGHRLTLPIRLKGTWLDGGDPESYAAALLTGSAWLDQPGSQWLTSLQPLTLTLRGYLATENLVIDLSDDQLIAVERARGDDDLALRLDLQAVVLGGKAAQAPMAQEQLALRIPRTHWLEQLDRVGSEVGIVLRVPSPLTDGFGHSLSEDDGSPSLSGATARLREARRQLRDHQWQNCVATCRKVLEQLERLVRLPKPPQLTGKVRERSKEERWAALYYDVWSLSSLANHDDEVASGVTWSRADAEAILTMTAALLVGYLTA